MSLSWIIEVAICVPPFLMVIVALRLGRVYKAGEKLRAELTAEGARRAPDVARLAASATGVRQQRFPAA